MNSQNEYKQLISLTKQWIKENYSFKDNIISDQLLCDFFKQSVVKKNHVQVSKKETKLLSNLQDSIQTKSSVLNPTTIETTESPEIPEIKIETSFAVESVEEIKEEVFEDVKVIFSKIFPNIEIIDETATFESIEKDLNLDFEQYKDMEVLLIQSSLNTSDLIKNLTHAINMHLAPAFSVIGDSIDTAKVWQKLLKACKQIKLIIIAEADLYELPYLMKLYEPPPLRTIHGVSLFMLADLDSYALDKNLKRSLWENLKKVL